MAWKYFDGDQTTPQPLTALPECPPWRQFLPRAEVLKHKDKDDERWKTLKALAEADERSQQRGQSFRILDEGSKEGAPSPGRNLINAVNAAIHLRRPLLVTGVPGSGKTSLAYAIAYKLQLGPVLTWPITARSKLVDAEYSYDAIARLQDAQFNETQRRQGLPSEQASLGDYIQLGPVGTAFLPSLRPRVLLIDEIDKSDLNLPNDLLNLFEEGEFEIPELVRRKRRSRQQAAAAEPAAKAPVNQVTVRTADKDLDDTDLDATIVNGRVRCCEFPIVIMTSNGEREFPPAFYRRCLRVKMPDPTKESLRPIVKAHFERTSADGWSRVEEPLIERFVAEDKPDRATDQLLNAVHMRLGADGPSEQEMAELLRLLLKPLNEAD